MQILHSYWFQLAFGISVVSVPFFIGAMMGKVSWRFFFSWTATSIFATLTFLFLKKSMEKNLSEHARLIVSIVLGIAAMGVGAYLRTIRSQNMRSIGLMFIGFGILWIALSV